MAFFFYSLLLGVRCLTSCAHCLQRLFGWRCWPGFRPGGRLTFLLHGKKVSKETCPAIPVLPLRYRQPVVLALSGVSRKLAALKQTRALIR